jgi:hypothetical protein
VVPVDSHNCEREGKAPLLTGAAEAASSWNPSLAGL